MSGEGSTLTRRRFLSTAATGLVSAGLANLSPAAALAEETTQKTEPTEKKIITRTLGRTGLEMPIVSMGVMSASNPEMVQASYETGMRYFHTSGNYQFGRNEKMVGTVINRLKVRDDVIIGTGSHDHESVKGLSPKEVRKRVIEAGEASLRRLGTDYVDIMYFHEVYDLGDVNNEGMMEGLQVLKDQGKVRYTGIATHSGMERNINAVVEGGFWDVVLTMINFTMADDTGLLNAIKNAADKGVGIIAMKTLAGGVRWPNPESLKNYTNSTIISAAGKWAMRNENITTCVPAYTNYEHLREDFSITYDLEYTPQEKSLLADNNIRLGVGFCRQCRQCLATCPDGVDVPTLMRTHMYATRYGSFRQARATLDRIDRKASLRVCNDCSSCQAKCAHTVDIAGRIDELNTIYC